MQKTDINIRNYVDYSSNNYGSSRSVYIGSLTLYFSYDTVVAFSSPKTGLVIRKNDWSTTTGRHLNAINENKKIRIDGEEFEKQLDTLMATYKLVEDEKE